VAVNVIIAEDESWVRLGLINKLRRLYGGPLRVIEAQDGKTGLRQIEGNFGGIDLVITDIRMPGLDGLEMANIAARNYPWLYIVALTGFADFEYARSALRAGARDYLLKPVKDENLLRLLEDVEKSWSTGSQEYAHLFDDALRSMASAAGNGDQDGFHRALSRILANERFLMDCRCRRHVRLCLESLLGVGVDDGFAEKPSGSLGFAIAAAERSAAFAGNGGIDHVIRAIRRHIDGHYHEDVTLAGLSEKFSVSPAYLSRQFKKHSNLGLLPYVLMRRMERARQLLSDTGMSVVNVADAVGIHDTKNFYRLFKREVGMTPSEYRNARRKGDEQSDAEIQRPRP
jgi:two-component system response regulator YesN